MADKSGQIIIEVVDTDGTPVRQAEVILYRGLERLTGQCDITGVCIFHDMPPTEYKVLVRAPGHLPQGLRFVTATGNAHQVIILNLPAESWTEMIVNGDFANGLEGWALHPMPAHHDGASEVTNGWLKLTQDSVEGGMVYTQMVDLRATRHTQFNFTALVDPVLVTAQGHPGTGILVDALRVPEFPKDFPEDKIFLGFNRCGLLDLATINGVIPPDYRVLHLWLVLSSGLGAVARFTNVSLKVR